MKQRPTADWWAGATTNSWLVRSGFPKLKTEGVSWQQRSKTQNPSLCKSQALKHFGDLGTKKHSFMQYSLLWWNTAWQQHPHYWLYTTALPFKWAVWRRHADKNGLRFHAVTQVMFTDIFLYETDILYLAQWYKHPFSLILNNVKPVFGINELWCFTSSTVDSCKTNPQTAFQKASCFSKEIG